MQGVAKARKSFPGNGQGPEAARFMKNTLGYSGFLCPVQGQGWDWMIPTGFSRISAPPWKEKSGIQGLGIPRGAGAVPGHSPAPQ